MPLFGSALSSCWIQSDPRNLLGGWFGSLKNEPIANILLVVLSVLVSKSHATLTHSLLNDLSFAILFSKLSNRFATSTS